MGESKFTRFFGSILNFIQAFPQTFQPICLMKTIMYASNTPVLGLHAAYVVAPRGNCQRRHEWGVTTQENLDPPDLMQTVLVEQSRRVYPAIISSRTCHRNSQPSPTKNVGVKFAIPRTLMATCLSNRFEDRLIIFLGSRTSDVSSTLRYDAL